MLFNCMFMLLYVWLNRVGSGLLMIEWKVETSSLRVFSNVANRVSASMLKFVL